MYNRNYGGFDYVRIHAELRALVLNRKSSNLKSVTDGYTGPSDCLKTMPSLPIIFQDMIFGMFIFKVWNINKDKTGNSSAFTQPA